MKTIAYLRVSTALQDAGSQRLAILEYAANGASRLTTSSRQQYGDGPRQSTAGLMN